jgi:glycosyltransferase involved in cell wall biosynthesis
MRILNVTQTYAPFFEFGGPPVKVSALAQGLAQRGHAVTVLTADWGVEQRFKELGKAGTSQPSPFGRRWKRDDVTAEYLANWWHYHALSWNPALGRYLRARLKDFDIVHIFGLYDFLGPRVAAECRTHRIPYVAEPIGMYLPIVRNVWLKKIYHRIWGRELLGSAAAIIATAEQERDELVAGGLLASKIVLRRNGVETPGRLPERGQFRRKLGIPETAKVILFLGRLSAKKSPELLLKAFVGLENVGPTVQQPLHLVFVGPDESGMRATLTQLARNSGLTQQIHFCGPLEGEAKWSAYRDADVFVLPSQNENFGNTAAEAVAAGTPVVLTDQCGIAPLLQDVAGLVVHHDEQELRGALRRLLTDAHLYRRFQEGCAKALQGLGWGEPVHDMEVIYSRLAGVLHS